MQHECRIAVIDKKCFTDYQEQYLADPKSGPCPFLNVGKTITGSYTAEIELGPVTGGTIKRQFDQETGKGFWCFL